MESPGAGNVRVNRRIMFIWTWYLSYLGYLSIFQLQSTEQYQQSNRQSRVRHAVLHNLQYDQTANGDTGLTWVALSAPVWATVLYEDK